MFFQSYSVGFNVPHDPVEVIFVYTQEMTVVFMQNYTCCPVSRGNIYVKAYGK